MKMRPIGIARSKTTHCRFGKASDFSNSAYDGVRLFEGRNNTPVIVMKSKTTAPLMWKVVYGFSQIFFRSFEDAIAFCESRGMQMIKEQDE
ncbi:MAG: hypothetical protein Q4B26_10040 [Eubacteriales bacterium]|nr:hypothetical protein [Eubacteriales bacterium]